MRYYPVDRADPDRKCRPVLSRATTAARRLILPRRGGNQPETIEFAVASESLDLRGDRTRARICVRVCVSDCKIPAIRIAAAQHAKPSVFTQTRSLSYALLIMRVDRRTSHGETKIEDPAEDTKNRAASSRPRCRIKRGDLYRGDRSAL